MKETITLDNNKFFYIIKSYEKIQYNKNLIDINKINLFDILKYDNILLKIDFDELKEKNYKKIIKKLLLFKNVISKMKKQIGINMNSKIFLGYIFNIDEQNKNQNDFILGINAIFFNTKYERYNYIYDTVCDFLDNQFYGKNLCDFKNNRCGEKRNTNVTCGCCRHFKIKYLGPITKLVRCEHLKDDYSCDAKCISCKLFTCDYLKKKGIKFRIKDILLLNTFFNPLQKYFIKYMVFTPKNKIINRLMFL